MEEESFTQSLFDTPDDLAADGTLTVMRTEDFGAWYRRVRDAHEREVDALRGDTYLDAVSDSVLAKHGLCRIGSAAMWDELRDTKDRELSEEHGLVRLPVDADGLPIHIGDKIDVYQTKNVEVVGVGDQVVFTHYYMGDYHKHFAADCRHHHEPTVEDVLREFAKGLGVPVADSYVAATAAKLQLREDK